jgi:type I restriction-modification system DNA methylase subunit
MSKTFDQGKDEVAKLCQYFATNRQSFLAPGVKEAHVRQSLIDPFFEALGWDVRNNSMAAPQYREVIPEDSLDVEGQQKAPDYTFRVGTLAKFYVEAKKCGVNISADPAPAYQLRRYGFSAKLALSILTDFDELGVYDCASRPRPGDKASHARIQYLCFTEYPDRWREIWEVFSREAVWSGTFDQYAASKRKRGTSEVDSEFLKDIEGWRDVLARNLALRNSDLSVDDLNAAVQRIIDRIVFLRMAEDRGLESYGQLLKLCEQPDIYDRFMSELCRKADQKYNSGLFHFQKEPGVSDAPDTLTPRLAVDDHALKPILQSLYFEYGSPYHFGVLPVEILGTVYERFLGKVIRLTAGHQAKVEEKPEVRKAGGVYYTPAYIVSYIVQNTIGKQIEGKSPADLAGGKTTPPFRVLDMACGSGSFLLGAYQFLLDHCLTWYLANPSPKHAKAVYQNAKGETCLTIGERKRILTTHIYGVDIDRQAVETTKLSLLLKALEGENDTTLSQQMTLFHERALPNLSDNIKCGNSLIASDFSMVPEDLVRVRAFDWPAQFPDAMKAGGFDVIVGNPPWGADLEPQVRKYLSAKFARVVERMVDTYIYFLDQALRVNKNTGRVGYVIPSTVLNQVDARPLRKLLLSAGLSAVINLGKNVFTRKVLNTTTLIVTTGGSQPAQLIIGDLSAHPLEQRGAVLYSLEAVDASVWTGQVLSDATNTFFVNSDARTALLLTLQSAHKTLGNYTEAGIARGVSPDIAKAHVLPDRAPELLTIEKTVLRRSISGPRIKRYGDVIADQWIIYTHKGILPRTIPNAISHLERFRSKNTCKEVKEDKHPWWSLHRTRDPEVFRSPKFIGLTTSKTIELIFDENKDLVVTDAMYVFRLKPNISVKAVLGILQSRLFAFLYRVSNQSESRVIPQIKAAKLEPLPFPDLSKSVDRARQDKLVGLVDKMLALTPKLRGATLESEKAALRNAVTTTDAEIDRLVYELYGLTDEEIKIVEGEC